METKVKNWCRLSINLKYRLSAEAKYGYQLWANDDYWLNLTKLPSLVLTFITL